MKTRRRIVGTVICIILLIFLFVHLSYALRGYTILTGYYGLKKNTVDVVFLGTSVTFSSFMPMEAWNNYGIVAYDYCTNVQFENVLKYSLVDIERSQSPRLIMIDVAPFLYSHYAGNDTWEENHRNLLINYNLDSRKYHMDRLKLVNDINLDIGGNFNTYWYYFFDIARYHNNIPDISHFNNAENNINRGYGYLQHNAGKKFTLDETMTDTGQSRQLPDVELKYLNELLDVSRNCRSDIVFYCAPIYFRNRSEYEKKNFIMKHIVEKGFPFKDFSGDIEEIGLKFDVDFWNENHFDALGAEKVTKYFCEYLRDNFDIPDKRDDATYSNWKEDYKAWVTLKQSYEETDRTTP